MRFKVCVNKGYFTWPGVRGVARRFGLLTDKQLAVIALREGQGLGFSEIARRLGTTRQDIAATYRRAIVNVEAAWETLVAYTLATGITLEAGEGISLDELIARVIEKADTHDVRLRWGRPELYILLRGLLRDCMKDSRLVEPVVIVLRRAGSIEAYPRKKIEHVLEALSSLQPTTDDGRS